MQSRPSSRAASTRTSPSSLMLSFPMRMGAQKPSALIEAATSRTCSGAILRTFLFAGGSWSSARWMTSSDGKTSLRRACAGAISAIPLRRRRALGLQLLG